jgi:hypothetical protein
MSLFVINVTRSVAFSLRRISVVNPGVQVFYRKTAPGEPNAEIVGDTMTGHPRALVCPARNILPASRFLGVVSGNSTDYEKTEQVYLHRVSTRILEIENQKQSNGLLHRFRPGYECESLGRTVFVRLLDIAQ